MCVGTDHPSRLCWEIKDSSDNQVVLFWQQFKNERNETAFAVSLFRWRNRTKHWQHNVRTDVNVSAKFHSN